MKHLNYVFNCMHLAIFVLITSAHATNSTSTEAPNCVLTAFGESQQIDLKQYQGKVVYVDFWASWCGPCVKSFPYMNKLDQDLNDKGLQVIGINMDENADEAKQFLAQYPARFLITSDAEQRCAKSFGLKAMPSSYLIDRNGIIRYNHLGFRPGEAEEFRVIIENLLAEKTQTTK